VSAPERPERRNDDAPTCPYCHQPVEPVPAADRDVAVAYCDSCFLPVDNEQRRADDDFYGVST
jgi:predicted amidophosphoribosyltransferase